MGSGFNMPDGVYERDIPGYTDIEVDILFTCEVTDDCGEWEESDVTVSPGGGHDVEAVCPTCGITIKQNYEGAEVEQDYDERPDDYFDY